MKLSEAIEEAPKSPEIKEFLEAVFGRSSSIGSQVCASCGKSANDFQDELSRREYSISGLCQRCQDEVFNDDC